MLYVVATPIGNLKDISLRALEVLRNVDFILAEDTRTTKKLLWHYKISTPCFSFHQYSSEKKIEKILEELKKDKNFALVSERGTPGISDPGANLIREILKKASEIKIVPIPGPSAITAALSVCGERVNNFFFLGFLPQKKKRKKILNSLKEISYPILFYESSHRLLKTLKELKEVLENRKIILFKELTKLYEEIIRGNLDEIIERLEKEGRVRGEYVILITNFSIPES